MCAAIIASAIAVVAVTAIIARRQRNGAYWYSNIFTSRVRGAQCVQKASTII